MKKMTRKQDKDKTTQVVLKLIQDAEQLVKKQTELDSLTSNPFQPVPEFVEIEAMINQEKVNDDLEPNEVQVTLTGSDRVAALEATHIEYALFYETGQQSLVGQMRTKKDTQTLKHQFVTSNLAKTLINLKAGEIEFRLKKKGCCGSTTLETQTLKLSGFGAISVIDKHIKLSDARLGVQIMIHKATKVQEFEKVAGKKLAVGPILKPYAPLG